MKVLLFANDAMPFGELPTSGGGLRCWQLYQGLQAHGIEVVASMPAFTYLVEKYHDSIPEAQRAYLWNWATQDEIYHRVKPDAVLFASNWDHYGLSKVPEVPLIIDLHGSRLIETTMWNTPVDTDRKVEIFSKADCFLCAGQRQRNYFYGWLLQAGRVPEDDHYIRYIPVSLGGKQPERNPLAVDDDSSPLLVSGGGWFPWQNQSKTIFAACREIASRDRGRIEIFGTPHDVGAGSTEEDQIRAVYAEVERLSKESSRVVVNGYISRNELLDIYSRASVALEAMEYNLERELAFTTRTVEYLWCGLPVLYNHFGELSEHIREYDAGWCIDPTQESEIALALEEIFDAPERVQAKSRNAQKLVQDRFTWDKTIAPLVDFLQNPRKAPRVIPTKGCVVSRSSFLTPSGTGVDLRLSTDSPTARQSCVIPAEGISLIEVPLSVIHEENAAVATLDLWVETLGGKRLCRVSHAVSDLQTASSIRLPFPFWLRMRGGTEVVVCMELRQAKGQNAEVLLRGLLECKYPFTPTVSSLPTASSLMGAVPEVGCFALRFGVQTGRYYRFCKYAERAREMIRRGEWRRLIRAVRNRMPATVGRVLAMRM